MKVTTTYPYSWPTHYIASELDELTDSQTLSFLEVTEQATQFLPGIRFHRMSELIFPFSGRI
jgi:hypothetical protein